MFPPLLSSEKTYLRIKVTTKQPKTEYIETLDDGTIKIRLKAVPEKDRANQELKKFLGEIFGISKSKIEIISGATDTVKLVRIEGID
ncbi:MAG: DUF167 domain-containing protein [Candidatus Gracilibacteria bacterium]|nr:DUF167 domain-containing protein [Candidatus Gracilibacteria bacterium]